MQSDSTFWYAVRTSSPFRAIDSLKERGVETYIALAGERQGNGTVKTRPLISKLFFMKSEAENAREIEKESRMEGSKMPPIWIYRYSSGSDIQPISDKEFRLFRLLTAEDSMRCEVYHKEEYKIGDRLRVKGGPFAGYEGYARRIRKNKHVVVEIEGICAIALPFIHPDMLEKVDVVSQV